MCAKYLSKTTLIAENNLVLLPVQFRCCVFVKVKCIINIYQNLILKLTKLVVLATFYFWQYQRVLLAAFVLNIDIEFYNNTYHSTLWVLCIYTRRERLITANPHFTCLSTHFNCSKFYTIARIFNSSKHFISSAY